MAGMQECIRFPTYIQVSELNKYTQRQWLPVWRITIDIIQNLAAWNDLRTATEGDWTEESAAPSKIFSDCAERPSDPTAHSFKGTWGGVNISSSLLLHITQHTLPIKGWTGSTDALTHFQHLALELCFSRRFGFSDSKWNKHPWTHFHWDTLRSGAGPVSHLEIKCGTFHFCH